MQYLLIELYNGKSRYINEVALKEWVGRKKGKVGPDGVRVWLLEEHIIVQCHITNDEDEINDAHGWR